MRFWVDVPSSGWRRMMRKDCKGSLIRRTIGERWMKSCWVICCNCRCCACRARFSQAAQKSTDEQVRRILGHWRPQTFPFFFHVQREYDTHRHFFSYLCDLRGHRKLWFFFTWSCHQSSYSSFIGHYLAIASWLEFPGAEALSVIVHARIVGTNLAWMNDAAFGNEGNLYLIMVCRTASSGTIAVMG